ncbi:hypothetical protein RN01_07430 [Cupriavidus sp. SHE]|nr:MULTISPECIES: M15 family metallopeptidase [Cupriavidus]KWR84327.1 hypothetical protein RN01_07430 [Cupriavidus sp. SHE]
MDDSEIDLITYPSGTIEQREGETMPADLDKLDPILKGKALSLIEKCMQRGAQMRPNAGLRDPFEQGRLWRQSRSIEVVNQKITLLRKSGADFLAHCIERDGPQYGKPVTNAIPGFSWHQWGQALDFFWVVQGKAVWDTEIQINGVNGYQALAEEATKLGLTAGGYWTSLKDWPHIQLPHDDSPADGYTLKEIDAEMKKRFG